MGFRLGDKINVSGIARLGKKVLGETSRIGHKISSTGGKVVNTIERVPILGTALAPATGVVRSGLGLVQNVADIAGTGASLIDSAERVVGAGVSAVRSGDMISGMSALAQAKELRSQGQSALERSKKVGSEGRMLARGSGSAFKQSARDLREGVRGAVSGSLSDP